MSSIREELELAAFIREIDGNNKMGACRLAEKILDWQAARAQDACDAQSAESETQRGLSSTGEMQSGAQESSE